jgi:hypothetical protein
MVIDMLRRHRRLSPKYSVRNVSWGSDWLVVTMATYLSWYAEVPRRLRSVVQGRQDRDAAPRAVLRALINPFHHVVCSG